MSPTSDVDVIVVGAGPAGSCAALVLARAGCAASCCSSAVRSPAARTCTAASSTRASSTGCIPQWWEEAPIQRWVTRRSTMMMTDDPGADRRLPHRRVGRGPPYNGATAFRPDFDHWLADKASRPPARSWSAAPP